MHIPRAVELITGKLMRGKGKVYKTIFVVYTGVDQSRSCLEDINGVDRLAFRAIPIDPQFFQ
jgi:hypothetical protein